MNASISILTYIALFIIIVLGVASGNLLSTGITAYLAAKTAEQAAIQMNQQLSEYQRQKNLANQQQLERQRQIRMNDPQGRYFLSKCEEWRKADSELHGYTTQIELSKACGRYEKYINTGIISK